MFKIKIIKKNCQCNFEYDTYNILQSFIEFYRTYMFSIWIIKSISTGQHSFCKTIVETFLYDTCGLNITQIIDIWRFVLITRQKRQKNHWRKKEKRKPLENIVVTRIHVLTCRRRSNENCFILTANNLVNTTRLSKQMTQLFERSLRR